MMLSRLFVLAALVASCAAAGLWETEVARRNSPMFVELGEARCPSGRTCCQGASGLELCVYSNGVCCTGGFCCPSGQTCQKQGASTVCAVSAQSSDPSPASEASESAAPMGSEASESSLPSPSGPAPAPAAAQASSPVTNPPPSQAGTIILSNGNRITTVHSKV